MDIESRNRAPGQAGAQPKIVSAKGGGKQMGGGPGWSTLLKLGPDPGILTPMIWEDYVPADIRDLYEIHDFRHAAAILANEFPGEFAEICRALRDFRLVASEVKAPGGNESAIPRNFSAILRPLGWNEDVLRACFVVDGREVSHDTHKVDYLKGRVACDLEWNSKDQTFDRDLYAFRTFFEYDRVSVGILVTRSNDLDPWFKSLGTYTARDGKVRKYSDKYGASTTHMGKLLARLESGRNGGCPVLVFGITRRLVVESP